MLSWKLFFDGVAKKYGVGAGVVFVSPQDEVIPFSFTLTKSCSNNVAENQALLLGLEMALDIGLSQLEIYGDSQLVINQLLQEYGIYKPYLVPYFWYATDNLMRFS
ncbi:RVT_3 domain-containing protein [Cephalotus follicularis]|uniref:RVT_3 domain-containing protein n=1 Tax=Cephalotus follicularis TaxID=3775 RepID=A0A1Q3B2H6_CEPFO|nr:RVT_3 domain-containing protein [Cephalotus follicularis]